MNTRKLTSALMALGLSIAFGSAHAVSSWSFEDDDIDFVLDPTTLAPKVSGAITVGDIFVSPFEIPVFTKNGADGIPAGKELTGLAAVQLQAIINPGGGAPGVGSQYIFGAYGGGMDAIIGLGNPGYTLTGGSGVAGGGAAIAMWFNGTSGAGGDIDLDLNRTSNPATNCASLADCIDQVSRGSLFQVDGFGLDPDEFWVATQIAPGGNDLATVLNTNNNFLISAFNLALSNLFQAGADVDFINIATGEYCGIPGYIADGCVQFSASGTITGGQGLSNGAVGHSDFDGQKYVPEPGTLALLAAGLLGFGGRLRKRV